MLNCKCKKKTCLTCEKCSECGCKCVNEDFRKQKRNRILQPDSTLTTKRRRLTNTNAQNGEDNTDGDVVVSQEIEPEEAQDNRKYLFNSASEIFHALHIDSKSPLVRHLPSKQIRSAVSTWTDDTPSSRKAQMRVLNVYRDILRIVSEAICGDAAEHSVATAIKEFNSKENKNSKSSHSTEIINVMMKTMAVLKKRTTEFRTTRALLCAVVKRKEINQLCAKHIDFSISANGYKYARVDVRQLLSGKALVPPLRSVQRFNPLAVDCALSVILSSKNVSYISWGTKNLRVDGVLKQFPLISRKTSRVNMYKQYLINEDIPTANRLARSNFFFLMRLLTHSDSKLRKAVDYVTGFLVNDNFTIITKIINHYCVSAREKEIMLEDMEKARRYLKYGFDIGIVNSSACVAHCRKFGLLRDPNPADTQLCASCRQLFYFFHCLTQKIQSSELQGYSAMKAVNDCQKKAVLFMGHRMRVVNQQIGIQKVMDQMKRNCVNNGTPQCVITIDYKMKLDPIYYREKTVNHYGKRGMSWHGSMIQYYSMENCEGNFIPLLNKVYLDHIVDNENKQDTFAVISILEAVILAMKKKLPDIQKITLQSDNAGCYQNTTLMLLLPFISYAHGIEISRLIHTETQDGKSVLDAHFARSMQLITSWCKEGHDCVTPSQAVAALKAHGGLYNCSVELVKLNRGRLQKNGTMFSVLNSKLKKYAGRTNDILFYYKEPVKAHEFSTMATYDSVESIPSFSLKLFLHSGIVFHEAVETVAVEKTNTIELPTTPPKFVSCSPNTFINIIFLSLTLEQGDGKTVVVNPSECTCTTPVLTDADEESENEINSCDEESLQTCDMAENETLAGVDGWVHADNHFLDVATEVNAGINSEVEVGKLTGITIVCDQHISKRAARWTRPTFNPVADLTAAYHNKRKDLKTYAVKRALKLQDDGVISFSKISVRKLHFPAQN